MRQNRLTLLNKIGEGSIEEENEYYRSANLFPSRVLRPGYRYSSSDLDNLLF